MKEIQVMSKLEVRQMDEIKSLRKDLASARDRGFEKCRQFDAHLVEICNLKGFLEQAEMDLAKVRTLLQESDADCIVLRRELNDARASAKDVGQELLDIKDERKETETIAGGLMK